MFDHILVSSQVYEESEKLADKLRGKGIRAFVDCVEIQSAYSNAIQWFHVKVPENEREAAEGILNEIRRPDDHKFQQQAKRLKTRKDGWLELVAGGTFMLVGVLVFAVSAELVPAHTVFLSGLMLAGTTMILRGIYRLKK